MSKIFTLLALLLLRVFSILPRKVSLSLGSFLGVIGYTLVKSRRNIGIKNLSLCFPQMTEEEKHKIIKNHFKQLLMSGVDYGLAMYANADKIKKMITYKNIEYIDQFYGKQPIILLCPHFVGLEFSGLRLSLDYVGFSMATEQKNEYIAAKLKNSRERFMKHKGGVILSRMSGLRPVIRKLKEEKNIFYYLPDQDMGAKDSLFIPFFAYPECATIYALPKLVQLSNAVVIPTVIYRNGDGYILEFSKPLDNYPTDNLENDVIKMNQAIEKLVEPHIEEYFWLHKRFKTQKGIKERGLIYK
jgi:Kdo2-lipid IVA lauroyltransferase/acyltransferase